MLAGELGLPPRAWSNIRRMTNSESDLDTSRAARSSVSHGLGHLFCKASGRPAGPARETGHSQDRRSISG
jgi:hypothetical protein